MIKLHILVVLNKVRTRILPIQITILTISKRS